MRNFFERPNKQEVETQKAARLREIERFQDGMGIDWQTKRDLVLLVLGEKPALSIDFHGLRGIVENEEIFERDAWKEAGIIKAALERMHLKFTMRIPSDREAVFGYRFLVARDDETLERLSAAEHDEQEFGRLMGYPETAVQAFKTDDAFSPRQELPHDEYELLETEGVTRFMGFKPSRSHWQEELEWARAKQARVKHEAPAIYEQIISG